MVQSDVHDAAQVIANGMSKGSVEAFKEAINANEEKVVGVVNKNVISTQKQVWDLFGVGKDYKSSVSVPADVAKTNAEAKIKVDEYIQQNPQQLQTVEALYGQDFTEEQVAEYLKLN